MTGKPLKVSLSTSSKYIFQKVAKRPSEYLFYLNELCEFLNTHGS